MNILITGAKGFVGRNLIENLKTIRDGKDRTRPDLRIDALYEYDLGNTPEEMVCALVQASPYMGLPRLLGAVSLIKDQLQEAADSRQQPGTDDSKTN